MKMCSIIKCACNENILNTTLRLETNTMKHTVEFMTQTYIRILFGNFPRIH